MNPAGGMTEGGTTWEAIRDEAPPRGPLRVAWGVMALVALLVAWSLLGRMDVVVVAGGRLVPESRVKIVQPAEGGVVRAVRVREGERVRAGQALLELDDTLLRTESKTLADTLARHRLSLRRVEAERDGRPLASRPGDDPLAWTELRAQWQANVALQVATGRAATAARDRAADELAAAREELAKQEATLSVANREREAWEALRAQGHVGEIEFARHEQEWRAAGKDRDAQQARVQSRVASLQQAGEEVEAVRAGHRARLAGERALLEAEIARLEQSLAGERHRQEAQVLRAPRNGVVQALYAHTPGTVVAPGAVLLTLVPDDEALQADVFVRNTDVARLRPGLPVQVKVHAFPFQKHGMLRGELAEISPDAVSADDPSAAGEGVAGRYRARVRFVADPSARIDATALAAGMWVSAEIRVGERRPVDYLLDPVRRVASTAGREP